MAETSVSRISNSCENGYDDNEAGYKNTRELLGLFHVVDECRDNSGDGEGIHEVGEGQNGGTGILRPEEVLVMFNPVCVGVEDAIEAIHGGKVHYWVKMISRAILMVICFVIAVSVPGFGSLVDLIGATAVMFLQIVFPVVFFLVLERKRVKLGFKSEFGSKWSKYLQYVVMAISLVLAVIGMIFGTWSAVLNW
mmetsp:Transcript_8833/g.7366  ORF Transcript_8833/g.7366 Transcript_8833/m.7366 type:complete len:194 (+) Transcript_8833:53-634(+)